MIFSKTQVNTGRQVELDLLKAFTVVFSMIIVHVYEYDTIGFEDDLTWWIDVIFGGILAAPMFMFCMGAGMEYSRNTDPAKTAIRGLKLLTIGQVLNLFRYALIFFVNGFLEPDYDFGPAMALNFSSDIMQLAGLSFLLMGLFRKLKLKNISILLIAVLMSVAGTLMEHVETGIYGVDQLLGLFWGTDTESYFPLLNWFIFIAAGKCFGSLYHKVADKKKFYLVTAPVGLVCFAAVIYMQVYTDCAIFRSFDDYGFTWMRLPDSLSVLVIAPFIMGIFYFISRILPQKTVDVLSHPSKHINQYYCVSWWWIMVIHLFVWADTLLTMFSIWLNILAFTIVSVVVYNRYFKEKVEGVCSRHSTVLTILVWVITLGLAIYAFCSYPNSELPNSFNGYFLH